MRKPNYKLPVIVSALLLAVPAFVLADDAAIGVVERLHESLVEVAGSESLTSLSDRIEALAPVIVDTHDLAKMGRLTVRRFWRNWTDEQKQAFVDAFEELSVSTYASRFSGVSADTFSIVDGELVSEGQFEVRALIHRPEGDDVPMVYLLESGGDSWHIVNITADGVSELTMMGAEYFDIIESDGFDGLIGSIQQEIAAL